jgi:hypothetical protein
MGTKGKFFIQVYEANATYIRNNYEKNRCSDDTLQRGKNITIKKKKRK